MSASGQLDTVEGRPAQVVEGWYHHNGQGWFPISMWDIKEGDLLVTIAMGDDGLEVFRWDIDTVRIEPAGILPDIGLAGKRKSLLPDSGQKEK